MLPQAAPPNRSWDADESYRALHPQEGEEASQQPPTPIVEAVIAFVLAALVVLLVMALVAFATVWWLEASDCGDHATWIEGCSL